MNGISKLSLVLKKKTYIIEKEFRPIKRRKEISIITN